MKNYGATWQRRLFLKKISLSVIIITAALSTTIIGLTVYGNNVGNFVVSVEQQQRDALSLSVTGLFDDATAVLSAAGLREMTNITYGSIPSDLWMRPGGSHNDETGKGYVAYTFFLTNASKVAQMYEMRITVEQDYKGVSDAVRVMVYRNGEQTVYAKRDKDGNPVSHPDIEFPYDTTPFQDNKTVCHVVYPRIEPNEVVKYTVVMWLEGYDPECVNIIKGGAIRLKMTMSLPE